MKKLFWISSAVIFIIVFIILAISMTNQASPFWHYRLAAGLGFILVAGLFRIIYKRLYKQIPDSE
jgi:uncharacterized membrane protein YbhN (UPF0104 family)